MSLEIIFACITSQYIYGIRYIFWANLVDKETIDSKNTEKTSIIKYHGNSMEFLKKNYAAIKENKTKTFYLFTIVRQNVFVFCHCSL